MKNRTMVYENGEMEEKVFAFSQIDMKLLMDKIDG